MKVLCLLLLLCAVARAQTNRILLEKRGADWWAVWTNTPATFVISTSTNLVNWQVWMTKQSGPPLVTMELKLVSSNDFRYLKFEEVGPPRPPADIRQLINTLTNEINKRKKPK